MTGLSAISLARHIQAKFALLKDDESKYLIMNKEQVLYSSLLAANILEANNIDTLRNKEFWDDVKTAIRILCN